MKLYFTLNFWKDLWIWLNLFNKSFCLCPLICLFLTLQIYFIRFSMNVYTSIFYYRSWWAQTRITLQRTAYLYAEHWSASGLIPRLFVAWWAQVDSNHRPRAYQARALTTWAMSPFSFLRCISSHSRSLTFRSWWRWWESNPWPPACRAGALPAELHPHFGVTYLVWMTNGHSKLNNNESFLCSKQVHPISPSFLGLL